MLAVVLIDTAGTHPKGICEFVENRYGLLPLNPKGADMGEVSCNPNIALAAFYIGLPGFVFSVFVGAVLGLVFGLFRYFKKSQTLDSKIFKEIRCDPRFPYLAFEVGFLFVGFFVLISLLFGILKTAWWAIGLLRAPAVGN